MDSIESSVGHAVITREDDYEAVAQDDSNGVGAPTKRAGADGGDG